MRSMIQMYAVSATLLCGAMLISANAARAEGGGGGDPSPALGLQTDEGLARASDRTIIETLEIAAGLSGRGFTVNQENVNRLANELLQRGYSIYSLLAGIPVPAIQASAPTAAPPLTPPTPATPPPTAANCGQTGATCADDEARQRQARKDETKRAQAAAVGKLTELGIIIPR